MKWSHSDVFNIAGIVLWRGTFMPEFHNHKYTFIVCKKFQEIANCTNASIRVLGGIKVFRFYIEAEKNPIHIAGKVINGSSARVYDRLKSCLSADCLPIFSDSFLNHCTEGTAVLAFRHS